MSAALVNIRFEIWGEVQKVSFRKYTQKEAQRLGLHGWCENTPHGTVQGELEGPVEPVRAMKAWLESTGSPKSHIERAVFSEEAPRHKHSHQAFEIRK